MRKHTIASAALLPLLVIGCVATPTNTLSEDDLQPLALTAFRWELIELGSAQAAQSDGDRTPHLVFDADTGRVTGSGGVNRFNGSYTLDGRELTFGPIATTMMAGPLELMNQEQALLKTLSRTRSYIISDTMLALSDDAGQTLARFRGTEKRD